MDIHPGSVIASRYRVMRELGRGGMGAVYLVEHLNTGDHAALKVMLGTGIMSMESLERFKREARAPAKIKSEHVVKVLDADTAPELGGAPFLVMELLNGSDLQKLARERGRLNPDELVRYLQQASIALDKSHALGIVHRDLKPENIFLHRRENGSVCVKILDFGISKILPQASSSAMPMTALGSVMGTPLFMAPEQARGAVQMIGPQTDVWAIGLITVHLLTGEHYWGRPKNLTELMALIIRCELYPPSQRWPWLTPQFDQWLMRSCAREPAQRFSSVGEQVTALAYALGVHTTGATVTDPMSETSAAPSGIPGSIPMSAPYSPQHRSVPPPTPPTQPMIGPGTPYPPPMPYGSTTAAGAMSHQAPPETSRNGGGPSVFLAVVLFTSVFVLVLGIGIAIFAFSQRHTETTSAAVATTAPTAIATTVQTSDPLPTLHAPAATTTPPATTRVAAPPASTTPRGLTSAIASAANTPPPNSKSKHQQCVDQCVKECSGDQDPFGCAKNCSFDCPP